jgi:hypothetical protein
MALQWTTARSAPAQIRNVVGVAQLVDTGRFHRSRKFEDATKHAVKQFEKELNTDVATFDKDLTAAINEALQQV